MKKQCKKCLEVYPATLKYFYKSINHNDGLNSSCKECISNQSMKWQKQNPERYKEYYTEKIQRPEYKEKRKVNNLRWKSNGKSLEWQRKNKDKIKEYAEKRLLHKNHDISDDELKLLYDYVNSSCMYCGMMESDSIIKYNQRLHKDHAYNDGSDGIENCVLACKSCNSSKRDRDWDEWFIASTVYDESRYDVIASWLQLWEDNQEQ